MVVDYDLHSIKSSQSHVVAPKSAKQVTKSPARNRPPTQMRGSVASNESISHSATGSRSSYFKDLCHSEIIFYKVLIITGEGVLSLIDTLKGMTVSVKTSETWKNSYLNRSEHLGIPSQNITVLLPYKEQKLSSFT